jgi:hypothetical protein
MCFTDWVPDSVTQLTIGWSLLGLIILNILVNLYFLGPIFERELRILIKAVVKAIKSVKFGNPACFSTFRTFVSNLREMGRT